jgi:hypothetical protein
VLEQITITDALAENSVIPIEFEVVTLWEKVGESNSHKGTRRVRFISPSGQELGSFEDQIDISVYQRTRNQMRFTGLPIVEEGRCTFEIELQLVDSDDWENVASIPLTLIYKSSVDEQGEE